MFFGGLEKYLSGIVKKLNYENLEDVAHFNLFGGPRDLNVPNSLAGFE
jgi:hypothetical protein